MEEALSARTKRSKQTPFGDANLAIAGWIIIHVTSAQLKDDPAGVLKRINRA